MPPVKPAFGDGREKPLGTLEAGKVAASNWNGMYQSRPLPASPVVFEFSATAQLTSAPYCLNRAT